MTAESSPAQVAMVDQRAAAARDEAVVVATYWQTLRARGLTDQLCETLTENYQEWLLGYSVEDEA